MPSYRKARIVASRSRTNRQHQFGFAEIRLTMTLCEILRNEHYGWRNGHGVRLEADKIVDCVTGRTSDVTTNSVVCLSRAVATIQRIVSGRGCSRLVRHSCNDEAGNAFSVAGKTELVCPDRERIRTRGNLPIMKIPLNSIYSNSARIFSKAPFDVRLLTPRLIIRRCFRRTKN